VLGRNRAAARRGPVAALVAATPTGRRA